MESDLTSIIGLSKQHALVWVSGLRFSLMVVIYFINTADLKEFSIFDNKNFNYCIKKIKYKN